MADGSNNITNLSIEITANADRAARTFDRLASSAERMGGSARNAAGGMRVLKDNMKEAKGETEEASEKLTSFFARLKKNPVKTIATSIGKSFSTAFKTATGALNSFLSGLARIAMFRIFRSIVKDIGQSFKDLYGWSSAFGTQFAKSMNTINTASIYLRNSFAAMVSPIINALAPAFDVIVDKIVEVMNWVNKLISALTGAETYTIAKKVAVEWGDTFTNSTNKAKKSADKFKQSLMGFDEINSLKAPSTSSSGKTGSSPYSDKYKLMFEEKPLTGGFKTISDISQSIQDATKGWPTWLKWLLGIGAAGAAFAGLKALINLLKKLWDRLKKLILLPLPDWLRKLFGGDDKDGGGGSGNYDLNVDLKKGDWEILDELKEETALVPVGLQHWGWDNIQDWIGNAATVAIALKRWGWNSLADWMGNAVTVGVGLKHWGWDNLGDWIGRSVIVYVGLQKWGWTSLSQWMGADDGVFVNVGLMHWGWDNLDDWIGHSVTIAVKLVKWGWNVLNDLIGDSVTVGVRVTKDGWKSLKKWMGDTVTVKVELLHSGWDNIGDWVGHAVTVSVALKKWGWTSLENWTGADKILNVNIGLKKSKWTTISAFVGNAVSVAVNLYRGNFYSLSDWVGTSVDVYVNLKRNGGSVTPKKNNNNGFGGANGGGGSSRGGGAGRGRKFGGVFSGGIWSSIPQYAGGTTDAHGSLFLAGEAGPEIVGHVGNRTEILNRSQLASTMYQSVTAAMATAAGMYRDDSSSVDYAQLADAIAVAVAGELKRSGVGATYLDGRMLAQSINRESRRLGTPAVTF